MSNYHVAATQLRAARALLNWRLKDLADKSGLSVQTVKGFERDGLGGQFTSVRAVLDAYEAAGISFEGRGVQLTPAVAA